MSEAGGGRIVGAQQRVVDEILRLAVEGFGVFNGADDSAARAVEKAATTDAAVRSLVRTHVAVAGAQGFVTNLGGLVTLPLALPANVGASYLVQSHLAASIACVYDYDVRDDEVRAAIALCLLGNGAAQVMKQVGVEVGKKLGMTAIRRLQVDVIRCINRQVGFMLLAKYGTKRAPITLVKGVPVIGGVVAGGVDAAATRAVGAFAKSFFSADSS